MEMPARQYTSVSYRFGFNGKEKVIKLKEQIGQKLIDQNLKPGPHCHPHLKVNLLLESLQERSLKQEVKKVHMMRKVVNGARTLQTITMMDTGIISHPVIIDHGKI